MFSVISQVPSGVYCWLFTQIEILSLISILDSVLLLEK